MILLVAAVSAQFGSLTSVAESKFVFCMIEKVGCTRFKYLLWDRAMRPRHDGARTAHADWSSRISDPTWLKYVFYRDPLTRFLSGYLEKCFGRPGGYCKKVFGDTHVNFSTAVASLRTHDKHRLDGHFRQQADRCGIDRSRRSSGMGPLSENLRYWTAQELEPKTSRQRVGAMLRRANISAPKFNSLFPRQGYLKGSHDTRAATRLEQYYTDPRDVEAVVDFFSDDYLLFQIPLPDYARRALTGLKRANDVRMEQAKLERLLAVPSDRQIGA